MSRLPGGRRRVGRGRRPSPRCILETAGGSFRPSTAPTRLGIGRLLRARVWPTRSDVDLEAACEQLRLDHLRERLVRLSALGVRGDDELDPRVRATPAGASTTSPRAARAPRRCRRSARRVRARAELRSSCSMTGASQQLADLCVIGTRHVLRQHRDVIDEQTASRVADRSEFGGETLLTGRRRSSVPQRGRRSKRSPTG